MGEGCVRYNTFIRTLNTQSLSFFYERTKYCRIFVHSSNQVIPLLLFFFRTYEVWNVSFKCVCFRNYMLHVLWWIFCGYSADSLEFSSDQSTSVARITKRGKNFLHTNLCIYTNVRLMTINTFAHVQTFSSFNVQKMLVLHYIQWIRGLLWCDQIINPFFYFDHF